jgi:hypothetical protein
VIALHALWNSPIRIPLLGDMTGFVLFRVLLGLIGWVIILSLTQAGIRQVAMAQEDPVQDFER